MPMIEWRPAAITALLAECAEIALRHYETPEARLKSDRSLVTKADREVEAHFESRLDDPGGDSYIIGEETIDERGVGYVERAMRGVAWVVDPIDGTAPYAHHIPTWGISIGRMEAGRLTDGAIYLPVTDELFITDGSEVMYGPINGESARIDAAPTRVPKAERTSSGMIALTQGVAKGNGIDVANPVQALGCAVLPLTYLLLDRYIGYIGKVKLWDVAGVLPMLHREGFVAVFPDGTPVGLAVDETVYRLSTDDKGRWKLRNALVCAATRDLADYIVAAIIRR